MEAVTKIDNHISPHLYQLLRHGNSNGVFSNTAYPDALLFPSEAGWRCARDAHLLTLMLVPLISYHVFSDRLVDSNHANRTCY